MSNVIRLPNGFFAESESARIAALAENFARGRRNDLEVYWLKENAEFLNVMASAGCDASSALDIYRPFFETLRSRLEFFPQYYRFLLSLCLDLEDLGMDAAPGGTCGADLVTWLADEGVAEAELSDLQRGEARRLMLRRGRDPLPRDTGLNDRLRAFAARAETFALPNRKAAYELTHIVFYLSEYGQRDPDLPAGAARSLDFAGTLAYLDRDADLLAEICIALRFAGCAVPPIWEGWLDEQTRRFALTAVGADAAQDVASDQYHEYLMCHWLMMLRGARPFAGRIGAGPLTFRRGRPAGASVLRGLSAQILAMGAERSDDWARMRPLVAPALGEEGLRVLQEAETASQSFEVFFALFARVRLRRAA